MGHSPVGLSGEVAETNPVGNDPDPWQLTASIPVRPLVGPESRHSTPNSRAEQGFTSSYGSSHFSNRAADTRWAGPEDMRTTTKEEQIGTNLFTTQRRHEGVTARGLPIPDLGTRTGAPLSAGGSGNLAGEQQLREFGMLSRNIRDILPGSEAPSGSHGPFSDFNPGR